MDARTPLLSDYRSMTAMRGLTLIELSIVLAISAIFVAFLAQAIYLAATAYNQTSTTLSSQAQLHYALARIARELREARTVVVTAGVPQPRKYDFASPATPTNGSTAIQFTKNDGVTVTIASSIAGGCAAAGQVCIRYSSVATTGQLADIATTGSPLVFNFYDHNTSGTTASTSYVTYSNNTANLGAVEVTLTVTANGITSGPLTTRVALRGTE